MTKNNANTEEDKLPIPDYIGANLEVNVIQTPVNEFTQLIGEIQAISQMFDIASLLSKVILFRQQLQGFRSENEQLLVLQEIFSKYIPGEIYTNILYWNSQRLRQELSLIHI